MRAILIRLVQLGHCLALVAQGGVDDGDQIFGQVLAFGARAQVGQPLARLRGTALKSVDAR